MANTKLTAMTIKLPQPPNNPGSRSPRVSSARSTSPRSRPKESALRKQHLLAAEQANENASAQFRRSPRSLSQLRNLRNDSGSLRTGREVQTSSLTRHEDGTRTPSVARKTDGGSFESLTTPRLKSSRRTSPNLLATMRRADSRRTSVSRLSSAEAESGMTMQKKSFEYRLYAGEPDDEDWRKRGRSRSRSKSVVVKDEADGKPLDDRRRQDSMSLGRYVRRSLTREESATWESSPKHSVPDAGARKFETVHRLQKRQKSVAIETPDISVLEAFLEGRTLAPEALQEAFREAEKVTDPAIAIEIARMVNHYIMTDKPRLVVECGGHVALVQLMHSYQSDPAVIEALIETLFELRDRDREGELYIAEYLPPAIRLKNLGFDRTVIQLYLDLIQDFVDDRDSAILDRLPKTKILKDCDLVMLADVRHIVGIESVETAEDIRQQLRKEKEEPLLKDVYGFLMNRSHIGETLEISKDRPNRRLWRFICRKMPEYGVQAEITGGVTGFVGSEFMYGCMALQLLASIEQNRTLMWNNAIPSLLVKSLEIQRDEQVAQHAVLTLLDLAQYPDWVSQLMQDEDAKRTIVDALRRGREATQEDSYDDVEDLVGPRVRLIEATAIDRTTYSGTQVLEQLIETWNDYDFCFYGNIRVRSLNDLKRLFRADKKSKNVKRDGRKREAIKRRASQLFHRERGQDDDDGSDAPDDSTTTAATPNGRLVSMPETSPLERRKSIIGGAGKRSPSPTGGGPEKVGLVRRASAFFRTHKDASPSPATGSIAFARRQSMAQQSSSMTRRASLFHKSNEGGRSGMRRRSSFFGNGGSPIAGGKAIPPGLATANVTKRASALQRRASIGGGALLDAKPIHRLISETSEKDDADDEDDGDVEDVDQMDSRVSDEKVTVITYEDTSTFVPKMLEYVFKALRKTASPDDYGELYFSNVPMRLVGMIADPETPPACFANVLYLIGALASYKDLRDLFGEYHAIESILMLIKRAYKELGSHVSETVTNGCLTLAALVVVHLPNTRRFEHKGGCEMAVDVITTRGKYNDSKAVNAGSALICNLCFKNMEMKEALGESGACSALTQATLSYERTNLGANSRSLGSLFRAIGNLALNEENMKQFLESKIEVAFASFLGQVDEELDTDTVESCFRTLSNLLIEKEHMQTFSVVLLPFLSMLRKERQTSAEVHRWAFLALANLCRWPENAQTFAKNAGIETIMMLIPYLEHSDGLLASVIQVLGIQTVYPPNIEALHEDSRISKVISDNLRQFITDSETNPYGLCALDRDQNNGDTEEKIIDLETHAAMVLQLSQLPITSLRCAHRVLNSLQAAGDCVNYGVFQSAVEILIMPHKQPMLSYEALRVIFAVISYFRGDAQATQENTPVLAKTFIDSADDPFLAGHWSDDDISKLEQGNYPWASPDDSPYFDPTLPEWQITPPPPLWHRPKGPRVWEQLNLTSQLNHLVTVVREIASDIRSHRNIRFQRICIGFLAFVACEQVCITTLLRRPDMEIDPVTQAPIESDSDEPEPLVSKKEGLARQRTVWDAFKRDKREKDRTKETEDQRKSGFGRDRIPDPTSIPDIISRTFQNFWYDEHCITEAFILLNSITYCAYGCEQLAKLVGDVELYRVIREFMERQPPENVRPYWIMSLRNYKRFIQTKGRLSFRKDDGSSEEEELRRFKSGLASSGGGSKRKSQMTEENLRVLKNICLTEFPYELTQWHVDPFPDGTMSLPSELRQRLRCGGKCESILNKGDKELFLWKASHDLVSLEWKTMPLNPKNKEKDMDPTYPYNIATSRLTTITLGTNHPYFANAKSMGINVPENKCCVIRGPSGPSCPDGVNLCLKFRDQSSAREFIKGLNNWREACAFGFL